MFCRSLFVLFSFFVWPLCCLSFFDLRILIIPLVSSNSSQFQCKHNLIYETSKQMHNKQRNIITSFYYDNFFWVFSKAYKTLNSHYNSINTNRNFTAYSCLIRGIHIALNNLLRFALIYKTNKKKGRDWFKKSIAHPFNQLQTGQREWEIN